MTGRWARRLLGDGSGRAALLLAVLVGTWWACGDKEEQASALPYDVLCPSPGGACASNSGQLLAAAAVRDITPDIPETYCDCGLDGICADAGPRGLCNTAGYTGPDAGENNASLNGHWAVPGGPEPWDDVDGDGLFDAVWIAGYHNDRPAQGVHDPIEVRVLVLRKGDVTLAVATVDLVGYFYDEVERIRASLPAELGIDLLLVSASHTHEAPDSIGIWGFDEGTTGVDPAFMANVRSAIGSAVAEAVSALEPVELRSAAMIPRGHPDPVVSAARGLNNLVTDNRDPVVMDRQLRVLNLQRPSDGSTVATLVNWANHPEALCADNVYLSADFVHYLRNAVENGVHRGGYDVDGIGGVALYVNGAVGGMQSPGRISITDLDGTLLDEHCGFTDSADDPMFDRPRAIGEILALDVLELVADTAADADPELSFATKRFRIPVENWGYHAMFLTGVFYGACEREVFGRMVPSRCLFDFDSSRQIRADNLPHLETEVAVLNLGTAQVLTAPGEMLPEWFVGGYDGSERGPEQELINSWENREPTTPTACGDDAACAGVELLPGRVCGGDNCRCMAGVCRHESYNPPKLNLAPAGPYLRDKMRPGVRMLWGLTPDELGYIIPPFNFELDDAVPYVEQAPGDHYEETNSVGVQIGPEVERRLSALLELF